MRTRTFLALVVLLAAALGGSAAQARQPSADPEAAVEAILQSLSPRERILQLFMVGFQGPEVSDEVRRFIAENPVGGVFLSRVNCNIVNGPEYDPAHCAFPADEEPDTPGQVAALTRDLQAAACQATRGQTEEEEYCLPLFVAVDHEGDGRPLTRLLGGFTPIPSNMAIGATFDPDQAEAVGCIVGRELAAVGVNMLLGPGLDVLDSPRSGGPGDQGIRVFGGNPLWVAEMGSAYIRGVQECGQGRLATVAKHFPGHGRSTRRVDYEDVALVLKTLEELGQVDLVPFAAVAGGRPGQSGITDAIMNSHLSYPQVPGCDGRTPVTFSPTCMQAFAGLAEFAAWRRQGGLTVVDDLAAGAVQAYSRTKFGAYQQGTIALEALMAGNDVLPLIRPWQWQALQPTVDYLLGRYQEDEQVRARVDDAARRVLALKYRLYPGLSPEAATAPGQRPQEVGRPESADTVASIVARALTLIQPKGVQEFLATLPTPAVDERILFIECWDDPTCSPPAPQDAPGYPPFWPRGKLAQLALAMFPGRVLPQNVETISFSELGAVLRGEDNGEVRQAVEAADWLVFAFLERDPARFPDSDVLKDFLGRGPALFDLRSKRVVVFAYNSPYHLDAGELQKVDLFIALYTKIEPALRASLKALFQDPTLFQGAGGRGSLPVDYIYGDYVLYDLSEEVQPDASQPLQLAVQPRKPAPGEEFTVALAAPLLARNGHRVPDGTPVRFAFDLPDGTQREVQTATRQGTAQARISSPQEGTVTVTVESGPLRWSESISVGGEAPPPPDDSGPPADGGPPSAGEGGGFPLLAVALAAGIPLGAAAVALPLYLALRRRERAAAPPTAATAPTPAASSRELRVERETHRVFVGGREVVPPLSREQYELLAYLYENAGRLCPREEIIRRVWPGAEASGVSEEALDSLVHRLRERLRAAGAPRQLIVTVRGRGFRLDL